MKRNLILSILIAIPLLALCLFAVSVRGQTGAAVLHVGEQENISEADLRSATRVLKRYFRLHFSGCTMDTITYDESLVGNEPCQSVESYLNATNQYYDGQLEESDVITFFVNFHTGAHPAVYFSPYAQHSGYKFTMIKGSSGWEIVPGLCGYG